jgi:hypothetical protein
MGTIWEKEEIKKKKEKMKKKFDTHRPSHGRSWEGVGVAWDAER